METTVKAPSEARVRLERYLEARRRAKAEGRVQRASNKEMLEQLERHHRLLIEAAKKAGLPSAYDYDDF